MLISPVEVFKESLQIYKTNFKSLFRVLFWPLVVLLLLTVLDFIDQITNFNYLNYTFPIYLVLVALSFVIGLWVSIVLIRLIWSGFTHQTVDKKLFYEAAWRDTAPYLWVSIIAGAIILLGTILLIVPGLVFMLWFSLSTFICVIEGTHGYAALKQSRAMIEGRFWRTVWLWVAPNFLVALIMLVIIGVPTIVVGYIIHFAGFGPSALRAPWWSTFFSSLGSLLILPLTSAISVLIYKTLKENPLQKEN